MTQRMNIRGLDPAGGSNGDVATINGDSVVYLPPSGGGGGGGSLDPRILFYDSCLASTPPFGATVTGSLGYDFDNDMRTFDETDNYAVDLVLGATGLVVEVDWRRLTGSTVGGFEIILRKGATQILRLYTQADGNVVGYNTTNGAMFQTGQGYGVDGTGFRAALSISSTMASAGMSHLDGAARWTSGKHAVPAGLAAGDTVTLELKHSGTVSTSTGVFHVLAHKPGGRLAGGGVSDGSATLADLIDVDLTGATDGNMIVLDSGLWVPVNGVQSIVPGVGVTVDNTDPSNPVVNADGGGGGSSPWTLAVDNPLSSLTGFTSTGTWAISGGVTRQSSTANSIGRHVYNTRQPLTAMMAQCEIMFTATPNTVSSRAGFSFGGVSNSVLAALICELATHATGVDYEEDSVTNLGANDPLAASIIHGTWITFKVVKFGRTVSAYVNGALVGSAEYDTRLTASKFSLYTYAADASFRNLKLWTPTMP